MAGGRRLGFQRAASTHHGSDNETICPPCNVERDECLPFTIGHRSYPSGTRRPRATSHSIEPDFVVRASLRAGPRRGEVAISP